MLDHIEPGGHFTLRVPLSAGAVDPNDKGVVAGGPRPICDEQMVSHVCCYAL